MMGPKLSPLPGLGLVAGGAAGVVLVGNLRFLFWLARHRGVRLAVVAVPLRLLYYLLNGVAAAAGILLHATSTSRAGRRIVARG
jgi:hypothetical protein